ncbi:hypothetical protein ACFYZ4_28230 [Streptomyces sp. NPDC001513]|uniref:hypothetical protein n=1 Tax=Streptomyces sp. NPDC001513 TaxID=3364580 RepID=UPI003678EB15
MSFSFTNPQPEDDRSFSFTQPDPADVEERLRAITDMAHRIIHLVAEVRRQIRT